MQKVENNRSVSIFFWWDSTQDGNQPDKGGNQPVGFHLVGFHLDNIDGPYGIIKSYASSKNLKKVQGDF